MKSAKSLLAILLSTGVGISLSLLLPQTAWTQTATNVNPLEDLDPQQQDRDIFSRTNDNPSATIFDLMHRAQQGNIRSVDEYNAEQNKIIDDAATQFRQEQLRMIKEQNQPANPVTAPQ